MLPEDDSPHFISKKTNQLSYSTLTTPPVFAETWLKALYSTVSSQSIWWTTSPRFPSFHLSQRPSQPSSRRTGFVWGWMRQPPGASSGLATSSSSYKYAGPSWRYKSDPCWPGGMCGIQSICKHWANETHHRHPWVNLVFRSIRRKPFIISAIVPVFSLLGFPCLSIEQIRWASSIPSASTITSVIIYLSNRGHW